MGMHQVHSSGKGYPIVTTPIAPAASNRRYPFWLDQSLAATVGAVLAEIGQWTGLPFSLFLLGVVVLPHLIGRPPLGLFALVLRLITFVAGWVLVAAFVLIPVGIILAFTGHGTFETVFRGLGYLWYLNFFLNVAKAPIVARS